MAREKRSSLAKLCSKLGIKLESRFQGISKENDGTYIHNWSVTVHSPEAFGMSYITPYRTGTAYVDSKGRVKKPTVADVVEYLLCDASVCEDRTFDEACSEWGKDPDSRKALEDYIACQRTLVQLRRLFGYEGYIALQEASRADW